MTLDPIIKYENPPVRVGLLELTIYQKGSNAHTKFIVLKDGHAFPEENFQIAKKWMEDGLLPRRAAAFIQDMLDQRLATFPSLRFGGKN